MNPRANFVSDTPLLRLSGYRTITHEELRRAAVATIPALIAATAIGLFAAVRLVAAVDAGHAAALQLALAQAHARYPLRAKELARSRSVRSALVAHELQSLEHRPLEVLAPLVRITNALPSEVRIKSLRGVSPTGIDITEGEALSYDAIEDTRSILLRRGLHATIDTTTPPSQNEARWDWSATVR